jgi:hypothetical protein
VAAAAATIAVAAAAAPTDAVAAAPTDAAAATPAAAATVAIAAAPAATSDAALESIVAVQAPSPAAPTTLVAGVSPDAAAAPSFIASPVAAETASPCLLSPVTTDDAQPDDENADEGGTFVAATDTLADGGSAVTIAVAAASAVASPAASQCDTGSAASDVPDDTTNGGTSAVGLNDTLPAGNLTAGNGTLSGLGQPTASQVGLAQFPGGAGTVAVSWGVMAVFGALAVLAV